MKEKKNSNSVQYALRWRLAGNRWRLLGNRWRLLGNRWRLLGNRWRLLGNRWGQHADIKQTKKKRSQTQSWG